MGRFVASAIIVVGLVVAIVMVLTPDGDGGSPSNGGQGEQGSSTPDDVEPPGGSTDESAPDELTVPDQPGGGVPLGQVDIRVEEGRTNGQREFATGFVSEVYGYTGTDQQEYQSIVEQYAAPQTFYDSAGGEPLAQLEQAAWRAGPASLEEYNISYGPPLKSEIPESEVEALGVEIPPQIRSEASLARMVYGVGEGADARYFAQQVLLGPLPEGEEAATGRWQLLAAGAPEPTEDPNADDPAPSAPKVMEPQGPGE